LERRNRKSLSQQVICKKDRAVSNPASLFDNLFSYLWHLTFECSATSC
jgi:hypothetical protein